QPGGPLVADTPDLCHAPSARFERATSWFGTRRAFPCAMRACRLEDSERAFAVLACFPAPFEPAPSAGPKDGTLDGFPAVHAADCLGCLAQGILLIMYCRPSRTSRISLPSTLLMIA